MAPANIKSVWCIGVLWIFFLIFTGSATGKSLIFNTQDFKPFSYLENGKVAGPFRDIIDAVGREAGFEVSYNLYPWRRAIILAKEGEAHGLFVLGWNKPRTEWLYFTYPVVNTEYGFFFRKDDPIAFHDIDHLRGKGYDVAVYGPSNTSTKLAEIALEVTDMKVEMTPDDIECFWKLSFGRVQAVYSNRDVGKAIIEEHGIEGVRYGGRERALKYYIGFLKNNISQETFNRFNTAYKKLYESGRIRKILNRHNLTISPLTKDSK